MAAPLTGLSKFQNVGKAAGPSDPGSDWMLEAGLVLMGACGVPGEGVALGFRGTYPCWVHRQSGSSAGAAPSVRPAHPLVASRRSGEGSGKGHLWGWAQAWEAKLLQGRMEVRPGTRRFPREGGDGAKREEDLMGSRV